MVLTCSKEVFGRHKNPTKLRNSLVLPHIDFFFITLRKLLTPILIFANTCRTGRETAATLKNPLNICDKTFVHSYFKRSDSWASESNKIRSDYRYLLMCWIIKHMEVSVPSNYIYEVHYIFKNTLRMQLQCKNLR